MPIGAIADRFGLRATMMAGAAIYVVGLAVMAAAGGAVALIVSNVFIGVALSCIASSLAMTAVANAVSEDRRSQTLGVVAAAGSLGTLLVPLATQALSAHQPWQIGALFFLALTVAMLPAAFWAGGADGCRHAARPKRRCAKCSGRPHMATLLGIAFVMHQVGSSLGTWGGGLIFDVTGSYDRAWQIGVLIGFTAGVVQILAGGRRRDRLLEPRLAAT